MSSADTRLVEHWRAIGPTAWAESPHGWITPGGRPVALHDWQRATLAAWWAHRADTVTLAISNVKKTGKTALNAMLLAWRWLALPGEHFAVGNDEDQSASRQFAEIKAMVGRNAYLKANVKVGALRLEFVPTGSTIVALPTDAAGNAGSNHATVSHTEAWGITLEAAIRAYEELTPPPGDFWGVPSLRVCDSYAGYESESTTWHNLVDAGLGGERIDADWPIYLAGGLLLFHMEGEEAQRRCFRGTPEQAARYYAGQARELRPMAYQRLHLNQRTSGAEAFITGEMWDACTDPEAGPLAPCKDIPVYVGLDLAVKSDHAAAVGLSAFDDGGAGIVMHQIWKPVNGRIALADVADWLRRVHREFWLAGVFYDPSQAQYMAQTLEAEGLRMVEVPQSLPELGPRGLLLWEAIRDHRLTVYPSDELRAAATAAVAKEIPQGLHIIKGSNKARKIDPIAALSFALPAALATPEPEPAGEMVPPVVYRISNLPY